MGCIYNQNRILFHRVHCVTLEHIQSSSEGSQHCIVIISLISDNEHDVKILSSKRAYWSLPGAHASILPHQEEEGKPDESAKLF